VVSARRPFRPSQDACTPVAAHTAIQSYHQRSPRGVEAIEYSLSFSGLLFLSVPGGMMPTLAF